MKLRLFSDVHREFGDGWTPIPMPDDKDTVLILAGDIDAGKHVAAFVDSIADQFLAIVYVAGNHEIYKQNIDTIYDKIKATAPNAHLLQNSTVIIGDTEFVGATLWTDFNRGDPLAMWNAKSTMNDYRYIRHTDSYSKISTGRVLHENHVSAQFLRDTIDPDKKQVVVTHHSPTVAASVGDIYHGSPVSSCYYNTQLDDIIPDAGLWVFGHTHHVVDIDCGGTRVVSNPKGYVGQITKGFSQEGLIEY